MGKAGRGGEGGRRGGQERGASWTTDRAVPHVSVPSISLHASMCTRLYVYTRLVFVCISDYVDSNTKCSKQVDKCLLA